MSTFPTKISEADLCLLNDDKPIPKNCGWIARYFVFGHQPRILQFYFNFFHFLKETNSISRFYNLFCDRTGRKCSRSLFFETIDKIEELKYYLTEAEDRKDLSVIARIKAGKYIKTRKV